MNDRNRDVPMHSGRTTAGPPAGPWPGAAGPLLGVSIVIVASLAWAWGTFGSVAHAMAYVTGQRLIIEPQTLTLNLDRPGQTSRASFRVVNLSTRALTVVGASSGCTCTAVGELPVEVPGRGSRELTIEYRDDGSSSTQAIRYYTDSATHPSFTVVVVPIASTGRPIPTDRPSRTARDAFERARDDQPEAGPH